jgi:hypothetical protein
MRDLFWDARNWYYIKKLKEKKKPAGHDEKAQFWDLK